MSGSMTTGTQWLGRWGGGGGGGDTVTDTQSKPASFAREYEAMAV